MSWRSRSIMQTGRTATRRRICVVTRRRLRRSRWRYEGIQHYSQCSFLSQIEDEQRQKDEARDSLAAAERRLAAMQQEKDELRHQWENVRYSADFTLLKVEWVASPVVFSVAVEPVVSDDSTIAHCSFIHIAEFFSRMCGVRGCEFGDRC